MKDGIVYVPALAAALFETHGFGIMDARTVGEKQCYAIGKGVDVYLTCSIKAFNPFDSMTIEIKIGNGITLSEIIAQNGDILESMLILGLPQMPETVKASIEGKQYDSLIEGMSPYFTEALALYRVSSINTDANNSVHLFSQKIQVTKGTSQRVRVNGICAENMNPVLPLEEAREINPFCEVEMTYQ